MKKLSETYIYQIMNKSNSLTQEIMKINLPINILPLESISLHLDLIKKRFNYNLREDILIELQNHNIIPVFNAININLPHFIPSVGISDDGGLTLKSYVNLTNYGKLNSDNFLEIDGRTLYALLQSGLITLKINSDKFNSVTMNQTILKNSALAYSKLFTKIIDKMFALNLNPILADKVRYLSAKFFLLNLAEKTDSENVRNVSSTAITNGTTKITLYNSDENFDGDAYKNINNFMEALKDIDSTLHKLSLRLFIENWMKMYGLSTVLALEYLPFFFHMIFAPLIGAKLNIEYIIEPLVGKEASTIYIELARIIR